MRPFALFAMIGGGLLLNRIASMVLTACGSPLNAPLAVHSEACVSRIEDRSIQSALEVELNAKQLILQGCAETPRTVSSACSVCVVGHNVFIRFHA